ncbi:330_t:CDS:2 [Entrophospora sp. SA101]|nr:330_t:CDS:2 [Entrophospora sp. SA101]
MSFDSIHLPPPPPYEQVPKVPLPVIVDVNGDDELPTYQQTVPSHRNPNFYSTNNYRNDSSDDENQQCCCFKRKGRSRFCMLSFGLALVIGISNNKACRELELNDSNDVNLFSFNPNVYNNFKVLPRFVKYGSINVSQSNSTNATDALIKVQYNSLANDKIQITQETYGNSYAIKIVQVNSITMFGLSIPPRCIVANIDITLPLIMDPNTNETTFHTDDFDITFAENANKYNQSLTINNEDSKIQFNNLSAKSLVINSNAGYVNGTITGIENNFSVIADDADLNLSVGIADNAKSAMVDIVNDVGIISTNYPQEVKISDNEHKANDINTSNNRFTNGSLSIKNEDGAVNVTF